MTAAPDWGLPERIGPYAVMGRLAIGGMAEILVGCRGGPGGRPVAIKRILPHLAGDESFRNMFLDESRLAAMIQHPNVVRVEDLGQDGDSYFMAMEFLRGETAHAVLRALDEPLDPATAAYVVAECAAGLHAAHSLRNAQGELLEVVHRDVSPHNVFLTYDGLVKLIDFGVARAAERITSTQSGVIKGKFAYMSPEQLLDRAVDHRSDQFSLGVVLHEMLTRRRLFHRSNRGATIQAVLNEPILPPSRHRAEVPPELDAICARALSKERDARFASCAELRDALMAYLGASPAGDVRGSLARRMGGLFPEAGRPVAELLEARAAPSRTPEPTGPTLSERPRSPWRRHGALALALGFGVAAAGAAVVVLGRSEPTPTAERPPAPLEEEAPAEAAAPQPAPVFLEISSEPPGASVRVPGEEPMVTPARIERPPSDAPFQVELRLEGHELWSREVTLDVSQRLHATLAPSEPPSSPQPEEVAPEPAPSRAARRRRPHRSRRPEAMAAIPLWD